MSTPPDPQGPSAYSPPPAAPAYAPATTARPKGRPGLGVVAFVVALVGTVAGSILAYAGGLQIGPLAAYSTDGTTTISPDDLTPALQQALITGSVLLVVAFGVMAVLALWALVQGIIAAVKNRGRGWGIAAIVVAVISWLPVVTLLGLGTAAGLAAG